MDTTAKMSLVGTMKPYVERSLRNIIIFSQLAKILMEKNQVLFYRWFIKLPFFYTKIWVVAYFHLNLERKKKFYVKQFFSVDAIVFNHP